MKIVNLSKINSHSKLTIKDGNVSVLIKLLLLFDKKKDLMNLVRDEKKEKGFLTQDAGINKSGKHQINDMFL